MQIKPTQISSIIEADKEYYNYETGEEKDASLHQKVRKSLK